MQNKFNGSNSYMPSRRNNFVLESFKHFSIEKARKAQSLLAKKVLTKDLVHKPLRFIAGVDVAYFGSYSIGAVAILDIESKKTVEMETKVQKTMFPYIPTLLSFREIPPAVSAIRKLKIKPDVYLVDGHGRAHPYKCGFASHLGLVIDAPTIGVAKKILCGEVHKRLGANWNPLVLDGEIIGAEVYTKEGSKPVYVSIGHMVSLDTAIRIVLQCSMDHRIPKPILEAHRAANQERERLKSLLI